MAKMPSTVGEVRVKVHLTSRRSFSFKVPGAHVRVLGSRVEERPCGCRRVVVDLRAGLTRRARLLVMALKALAFLRVRVDVEV